MLKPAAALLASAAVTVCIVQPAGSAVDGLLSASTDLNPVGVSATEGTVAGLEPCLARIFSARIVLVQREGRADADRGGDDNGNHEPEDSPALASATSRAAPARAGRVLPGEVGVGLRRARVLTGGRPVQCAGRRKRRGAPLRLRRRVSLPRSLHETVCSPVRRGWPRACGGPDSRRAWRARGSGELRRRTVRRLGGGERRAWLLGWRRLRSLGHGDRGRSRRRGPRDRDRDLRRLVTGCVLAGDQGLSGARPRFLRDGPRVQERRRRFRLSGRDLGRHRFRDRDLGGLRGIGLKLRGLGRGLWPGFRRGLWLGLGGIGGVCFFGLFSGIRADRKHAVDSSAASSAAEGAGLAALPQPLLFREGHASGGLFGGSRMLGLSTPTGRRLEPSPARRPPERQGTAGTRTGSSGGGTWAAVLLALPTTAAAPGRTSAARPKRTASWSGRGAAVPR